MKNAINAFAILAVAAVLLHSQALPQGPYKTTFPNGAVLGTERFLNSCLSRREPS